MFAALFRRSAYRHAHGRASRLRQAAYGFCVSLVLASNVVYAFEGLDSDALSERMQSILFNHSEALRKWTKEPLLMDAVKAQNAKQTSLDAIRQIDQEWVAGKRADFATSLQQNPVGQFLQGKVQGSHLYVEAFLCDNQGAVVGEYPGSSDYWQGDEDKFIRSFNGGDGKLFIGPVELDESTQTISVQMSVPVKEGSATLGVLVVGLRNIK